MSDMTLEEFVRLPTTVDFQVIDSDRFRSYAAQRPYLYPGTTLANGYTVVYTDEKYIPEVYCDLGGDFLFFEPKILSPVDIAANDSAGITSVLSQPFLDLSGSGVIIGLVDTGIDISLDAFRYADGSTRIVSLWDQTLDGEKTGGIYFGSVYVRKEIDATLAWGLYPGNDED